MMATKQMQVLLAVKALVAAALPGATIVGFDKDADKPARIGPGGCVVGQFGDQGEPEVDLSPLTYNWSHQIPVEVVGPNGEGGDVLDAMVQTLADAIAADPFLGGLCDWFGIGGSDLKDRSTEAVASTNWVSIPLIAEYSSNNALR
jgi:hypothetical protein